MASQEDLDRCYMAVAEAHAALSKGQRAKVGGCLVTHNGVILAGYNGLAPNGSNELEHVDSEGFFVTKPETIHSELNCLLKAAREGVSVLGSTLYTTLSPCVVCSEMLVAAGVRRVVYKTSYRCASGINNLTKHGVTVEQFKDS